MLGMFNANQYEQIPNPEYNNPYLEEDQMMKSPTDKPNIGRFMHDFNDRTRDVFNDYWYQRNDDDIINGMKKIILSCQRNKYFSLKVLSFEVIKDYEGIQRTLYEYHSKKTKNGKKIDNEYDYINLRDSDIMLLKVTYYVSINIPDDKMRIDAKTGLMDQKEGEVEVLIALPRYVNKYYFRIQGNMYNPVFQIVDGSTYNNVTSNAKSQTVTLKTQFMPIKVYREYYMVTDIVTGESKKCVLFTSYIFTKKTDACKFILGRYGFYGAMEFLGIYGIHLRRKEDGPMDPSIFYNFYDLQGKFIVSVLKVLFDEDNVTQSFVYTIIKSLKRLDTTTFEEAFNVRYWNKALGADFMSVTLDKGISVLESLESIYDLKTKECIRLPEEDKENTYCILRWIMREFSYLRAKDNLDISTKRPRMADEYLPAIYAAKISKGIYRICDKGKNITFKDIIRVIDTPPMYILKNINTANLVGYVDLVNDNDGQLALSYSYKGISGLGEQGSGTAVPIIYRSIHPSHLGRLDLDSSSASDPGLTGIICPMAKIYDGSFSSFEEPNGWSKWYEGLLERGCSESKLKPAVFYHGSVENPYEGEKEEMVKETIENYNHFVPTVYEDISDDKENSDTNSSEESTNEDDNSDL